MLGSKYTKGVFTIERTMVLRNTCAQLQSCYSEDITMCQIFHKYTSCTLKSYPYHTSQPEIHALHLAHGTLVLHHQYYPISNIQLQIIVQLKSIFLLKLASLLVTQPMCHHLSLLMFLGSNLILIDN